MKTWLVVAFDQHHKVGFRTKIVQAETAGDAVIIGREDHEISFLSDRGSSEAEAIETIRSANPLPRLRTAR